MAKYSIKDLATICDVQQHTIRMWEQRYQLLTPKRTETNIRYYTDEDVQLLLNVCLLNKKGYKISRIATMSAQEIRQRVQSLVECCSAPSTHIDALTLAMMDFDEGSLQEVLSQYIRENGLERAMLELVLPFVDKLTCLWMGGMVTPAHVGFVTLVVRQKLIGGIDALPIGERVGMPKIVLYAPEHENQELILLFMHYLLRKNQLCSMYFGKMALEEVKSVCKKLQPHAVFTFVAMPPGRSTIQQYVAQLAGAVCPSQVLFSGHVYSLNCDSLPNNVVVLDGLDEVYRYIAELHDQIAANKMI